jgi:hypothetical protein
LSREGRAAKECLSSGRLDYGGKGVTGFVALFCETIRPRAPLTRLTETSILTGLPQVQAAKLRPLQTLQ